MLHFCSMLQHARYCSIMQTAALLRTCSIMQSSVKTTSIGNLNDVTLVSAKSATIGALVTHTARGSLLETSATKVVT